MKPRQGPQTTLVGGTKPWKVEMTPAKIRPLVLAEQQEIDICLTCDRDQCSRGTCPKVRKYEETRERKHAPPAGPPPPDFAEVAPGKSGSVLASHYGVTECVIRRWRRETGVKGLQPVEVDLAAFERDARSGMTFTGMKHKYHIGNAKTRRLYHDLGIPIPPKRGQKKDP